MNTAIYKRDSQGKVRVWDYQVSGNRYRTIAGIQGGMMMESEWTVCTGKRGNTDEQQAQFEAEAERKKKLRREYRENLADIDTVEIVFPAAGLIQAADNVH